MSWRRGSGIRTDSTAGSSTTAPNWERGVQLSIFRSVAGELSNNVIQKRWHYGVIGALLYLRLGRLWRLGIPPRRLDGLCGASVVQLAWLH